MNERTFQEGLAAADRAQANGDLETALWIWNFLELNPPNRNEPVLRAAQALNNAGRHDEADRLLIDAIGREPREPMFCIEFARAAESRGDATEARLRWMEAQKRFPEHEEITLKVATQLAAHRTLPNDADPALTQITEAIPDRELVMCFESLGGAGHGCEFGLFQRHFGAEPLGLLRWADLAAELLAAALEERFEGVGDPEFTDVFVPHGDEYWTRDKRFWMAMRSFIKVDELSPENMQLLIQRRQTFLRRKLISDLETNTKVFVFKDMKRVLPPNLLARLHAAVRSYGDNSTLLYVRFADESHSNGTVVMEQPGLMVGYIDHFAFSPEEELLEFPADSWLAICRRAHALWSEAAADTGRALEAQ
jgi:tetratricopeptide (TPR) repeat protein